MYKKTLLFFYITTLLIDVLEGCWSREFGKLGQRILLLKEYVHNQMKMTSKHITISGNAFVKDGETCRLARNLCHKLCRKNLNV